MPGVAVGMENMAVCNNNKIILAHLLFLSLLSSHLHLGAHSLDLGLQIKMTSETRLVM